MVARSRVCGSGAVGDLARRRVERRPLRRVGGGRVPSAAGGATQRQSVVDRSRGRWRARNSGAYDLRQSGAPITESNFGGAQVINAPSPSPAGVLERHAVGDLSPDTRYCFAVRAEDEVPQPGPVSNSACIDMPTIPPDPISDLVVTGAEATALTLRWTASGAQGNQGTATDYELRMATSRITPDTWAEATPVLGLPSPAAAGTQQTHRVTGLLGQTRYYFALVSSNDGGQTSALSNSAVGTTLDEVAPTVITDLTLETDNVDAGRLVARWTAPGDGETGTLAEYDLRVSRTAITSANFSSATRVPVSQPLSPGQTEETRITGLSTEAIYYAAVRTKDAAGNWSAMSNVAESRTRDEAPGQVTDLAVRSGPDDTTLTLTWTAPGDDGAIGRAASYDIRYSTTYISARNVPAGYRSSESPGSVAGWADRVDAGPGSGPRNGLLLRPQSDGRTRQCVVDVELGQQSDVRQRSARRDRGSDGTRGGERWSHKVGVDGAGR